MSSVFLVQHLHVLPSGEEDLKLIGVYSSMSRAQEAVRRVSKLPGFLQHPNTVDPLQDDKVDGFYIEEYELDEDHWAEGYFTTG